MMNRRRLISLLLALCLCIGILSVTAQATGSRISKGSADYEALETFLATFAWWGEDYDAQVINHAAHPYRSNIMQAMLSEAPCYYDSFYPGPKREDVWDFGGADPLGKFTLAYSKVSATKVDWVLENIFNCSPSNIAAMKETLDPAKVYLHDGFYYVEIGGIGGGYDVDIQDITLVDGRYYVTYNLSDVYSSDEWIKHYAILELKNIDGKNYWSLHYLKGLADGETPSIPSTSATPISADKFIDVRQSDYFYNPVLWGVEQEIVSGTGANRFSPNDTCSKAQILTFIWRAAGKPEPTVSNPFTDVASSDYYCKPAVWAYEKGMVTGSSFAGSAPCTRSMAVTYLWQAAGSPAVAAPAQFTDVRSGAGYARAVAWAVNNGVTNGTGANTFSPDTTCNRGQIVTFLYRCRDMDLSAGQPVADSSSVGFYTGQWTCSSGGDERASMRITDVTSNQLSCEVSFYRLVGFEFVGSVDSPGHAKLYDAAAKVRGELILDGGQLVLILEDVPNFYFDSSLSRFLGGARFVFQ